MLPPASLPRSTYRLQLHRDFAFAHAQKVLPYLAKLGITDLYLSPIWQAVSGSTHGYDVTDPTQVSAELGGLEGLKALAREAHGLGLKLLVDWVPNHMGIAGGQNRYWEDVLEFGESSRFAHLFDINWQPLEPSLQGKVLLPLLGGHYGQVLAAGELKVEWPAQAEAPVLRYWERSFPLNAASTAGLTRADVASLNADPQRLDALLRAQHYRLAYWRVAAEEINYRRFFEINDLAGLRMEDERVFEWAHSLLLQLLRDGVIHGVRLDHTDGLFDPAAYFAALQRAMQEAVGEETSGVYVVAEKILEPAEKLPQSWDIFGTTGYDFLAQLGGVFVEKSSQQQLDDLYSAFTGDQKSYAEHVYAGKLLVQDESLGGEVRALAEALAKLAQQHLEARDFTLRSLHEALRQTVACFPVYRSYVRAGEVVDPQDTAHIAQAIADARTKTLLDGEVFDFLEKVLTLRCGEEGAALAQKFQQLTSPVMAKGAEDTAFYRYARLLALNEVGADPALYGTTVPDFHDLMRERAQHWPYGMLAGSTHDTKRGEDTRARLYVLSELPQVWKQFVLGWQPLFEELNQKHLAGRLLGTDLYTLLQNALGAYPLSGNLDDFAERLSAYMLKAAREAKIRTSWARPDETYETGLQNLTRQLLTHEKFMEALRELHEKISPYGAQNGLSAALVRLTAPGVADTYQGCESWNQSLVDPDNRRPVDYARLERQLDQLSELRANWESASRHSILSSNALGQQETPPDVQTLLQDYASGAVKLHVTHAALKLRQEFPELFLGGQYQPLEGGPHLLAFARVSGQKRAITVAPRLTYTLTQGQQLWATGEVWGEQTLEVPAGHYVNVLTGEKLEVSTPVRVAEVLRDFPVALLISL